MNRIDEIKAEIKNLYEEMGVIQAACPHPPLCLRYKYCANTGNWDRGDDSYWTELRCTLCQRRWNEDGSISVGKGATKIKDNEEV